MSEGKEVREETKEERKQRKEAKKLAKEEKKRKELEEIEINLQGDLPLNKKQQRLLKKGKLNLDKLKAKHPNPVPENAEKPLEKSQFGVWVGNLSFDTSKEDITRFVISKTDITNEDIVRFNLPKKFDKIKGFCYIDFKTELQMNQVIALSESMLNGRKLLIKNANSFEGRPEKSTNSDSSLINVSKNPPSRILFVGNLSFDTTEDLLHEHFKPCGDIIKIRMATFEDSGKCKGFAFIDFKDEQGATNALTSSFTKKFINRPLRMEYGEDRSKRNPKRKLNEEERSSARERNMEEAGDSFNKQSADQYPTISQDYKPPYKKPKRDNDNATKRQVKSSVALATAQRASAAIVPSSGKKVTFD